MWAATVLLCTVVGQCWLIGDRLGPYPTVDACEARTVEMMATLAATADRFGEPLPAMAPRCTEVGAGDVMARDHGGQISAGMRGVGAYQEGLPCGAAMPIGHHNAAKPLNPASEQRREAA